MDQGFAGWIHVVGVGGFLGFLVDDDDENENDDDDDDDDDDAW